MSTDFDPAHVEIWQRASVPTVDEPLCRARWGLALAALENLDKSDDPDAWFLWTIAVMHRYDYSVTPPGYVSAAALAKSYRNA